MNEPTQPDHGQERERRTVHIIRELARREAEALAAPLRKRIAELEARVEALEIAEA